jgi:hypothetical protein
LCPGFDFCKDPGFQSRNVCGFVSSFSGSDSGCCFRFCIYPSFLGRNRVDRRLLSRDLVIL